MSATAEALRFRADHSAVVARAALPRFLVVGPQRTGTTWLHRYLESRGDLGLPRSVKETFFFDRRWNRGPDWYARQFVAGARDVVAEVGPTYFHSSEAPARIRETLGPVPIVVMLRDPVERTVSLWRHMRRYGMTRLDFRGASERVPELLDSGRYAHHLERWFATFGRSRVLVLFHHDLEADPDGTVERLCRHVGLDPREVPDSLREHRENRAAMPSSRTWAWVGWKTAEVLRATGGHRIVDGAKRAGLKPWFFGRPGERPLPEIGERERARLRTHFRPEVERLEALVGADLSGWK